MLRRLVVTALFGAAALTFGYAQSTLTIPAPKTSPTDGKQMYVSYCAPCHGIDGKGQGPVASALIAKPIDLSVLAKNNNGKFPAAHFVSVVNFGSELPAHGNKDMPIWGQVFSTMDHGGLSQDSYALRVKNLESYVESLQVK